MFIIVKNKRMRSFLSIFLDIYIFETKKHMEYETIITKMIKTITKNTMPITNILTSITHNGILVARGD